MSSARFLQIKQVKKSNNNYEIIPYINSLFNLAHKFDLIYDCLVTNLQEFTRYTCQNQTIDRTSWSHGRYSESGTRVVFA